MFGKEKRKQANFSLKHEGLAFLFFMDKLIDRFERKIDYLRISVTDRCNLRCIYCMPASGILNKNQNEIISFEEIYRIVNVAVNLGIKKIRLTGGEPLVRKDLVLLIKKLKNIHGLREICLTTNGTYLTECAYAFRKAGLDRVNISLDSLIPEKFNKITRGGDLERVLRGIEIALSAGFSSLKINTVLINGFNTDEIQSFANLTKTKQIHVRFIEYMPTYLECVSTAGLFFSTLKAKGILGSLGELSQIDNESSGTARIFRIKGSLGTVGFISPISEPFCSSCNKLRLTSDGRLRSCLHSSKGMDLKKAIERGATDADLAMLIKEAVALKPAAHNLCNMPISLDSENFSMCQIGG